MVRHGHRLVHTVADPLKFYSGGVPLLGALPSALPEVAVERPPQVLVASVTTHTLGGDPQVPVLARVRLGKEFVPPIFVRWFALVLHTRERAIDGL